MFEAAELGTKVAKDEYKARVPGLRESLLEVQRRLRESRAFSVIVILAGLDTAGRGETANLLNEWMDPRWIVTRAWGEPSDEELERPFFWRYWRSFPQKGRVGVFHGAWYEPAVRDRVDRRCGPSAFDGRLDRIATLEKALTDAGTLIVKFWLHLDAESQRKRLKAFQKDPLTRWRVTKKHWLRLEQHNRIKQAAERAIRRTTTSRSAWHIVEGSDEAYRNLTVATVLRDAIAEHLALVADEPAHQATSTRGRRSGRPSVDRTTAALERVAKRYNVLSALDLTQKLERKRYKVELERQQGRLNRLQRRASARGLSTIAVFEGWDAAGKGGIVRRVTAALDAREYRVIPVGAPSDEELSHHYLWRFMRHLPRSGRFIIFDRSWYGRVLVERVEALASPEEYTRAYSEINFFEEQLVDHGILLAKFWLHISKGEQLKRFRERKKTPHKTWKITDEDWRNRRRWDDYERAVNEMVARTSTRRAPWYLIEANDKKFARVKVIRTLADRLERALRR
jgi:polyphosphate:AMP phosphotransferase